MSLEYAAESLSKQEFLKRVLDYNPNADALLIERAYDFAEKSHEGQKRLCGRPFFMHCKDVAYMLVKLRLDTATICAGLLHDVLEDTGKRPEQLGKVFGDEILGLVQGVTKIRSISLGSKEEERAENVRKVLLATIKDIRVILIKLADRLHNMRTLKYTPEESRKAVSRETLDIYVPVAYKLGMYKIKSELEDLCLKYLNPSVYQELKRRVSRKKEEREGEVKSIISQIKKALANKGLRAAITGRAKNFHSIYRKMIKKGIPFDSVHDLSAIRILTESHDDCYRILGILHSTWTPILKNFDDYIATPKPNMYQSLHTEVIMDGKPVEVQIRTWTMHHIAEEGIAAHWLYKDTERDKKFDRRIAWLKQILDWRMTSASAKEFVESLKIDLFKDEIYVITPKGDAIPLPEGATPVDFAYAVHTDVGNHCARAKVNNTIMPLDAELKSGDVVEIITAKNASPSRNWLQFVRTDNAKG
ncbi:bifunctional (p)ppGpp synthetase/guanosine-3',5'-bis(diphosphate) 3'-pyrophosphohydrolase, partial [Candidatus Woesearchaeota archaeon]|nr:bifunctional (p)ppGpp synthetase/guanosine-3',5'-bis(diphosphate) 3'-pyrophosphohydrolase [Candidatus Woesearchaeota archaeon]